MSNAPPSPAPAGVPIPPPDERPSHGVDGLGPMDEELSKRINEIELLGEERAARFVVPAQSEIGPELRYLHSSRSIHQLLMERTRAITVYLAAASLLWTASGFLLTARPAGALMVPIGDIQYWCLPVTSGTLTVLAVMIGLWLIRIRVGLIYEVAKMNVLLGVSSARVTRVNPFSISSLLQTLISLAGGGSAAVFAFHMLAYTGVNSERLPLYAFLVGVGVLLLLQVSYVVAIWLMTRDFHLKRPTLTAGVWR